MNLRMIAAALCAMGACFAASASSAYVATSCTADAPYFQASGSNIVCVASCAAGLTPTMYLPATAAHYAGKFCVATCTADFAVKNTDNPKVTTCSSCPDGKRLHINAQGIYEAVCTATTALDKFQDTCTGNQAAIRKDGYSQTGYNPATGKVETLANAVTYKDKNTAGGWICAATCPNGKKWAGQADQDVSCK